MKAALRNLMSCEEVLEDDNPLEAFSKGLLNFYSHYCMDKHDSPWCKFHALYSQNLQAKKFAKFASISRKCLTNKYI